jgi:energy-coupling factor transporter ATP-binding protein EcfA2
MLKLKRLKINKFRHVEPTELVFDDRYNVLLGINGSGKTTLLKLISACLRSDFSEYKAEEFDVEYRLEDIELSFAIHVENYRSESSALSNVKSTEAAFESAYTQLISAPRARGTIIFQAGNEKLTARLDRGEVYVQAGAHSEAHADSPIASPTDGPFAFITLVLARFAAQADLVLTIQTMTALFDTLQCYRFDESLEMLAAITGKPVVEIDGFPRVRPEVIFQNGTAAARQTLTSFVPRIWPKLIELVRPKDLQSGALTIRSGGVAFLDEFAKQIGLEQGEMVFGVAETKELEGDTLVALGDLVFRFYAKSGRSVAHNLLSYGQKRLLSFLYYVACNDAVIVADELVNGLHHSWIEMCLDAIGERQAFLTSQNPILLDYVPPASPEEAELRFVRCVLGEHQGLDVMVWRNLTPGEAKELCAEYAAGIQQLSELLRVQGLW